MLASVGDLTANSDISSIIISWSAPFSLDVTGDGPDIWYTVLIYDVTDNPTAIPCTDCTDITETHYTFTPDYLSPCHKYIFTVIPLNGAGQGHSSGNATESECRIALLIHMCIYTWSFIVDELPTVKMKIIAINATTNDVMVTFSVDVSILQRLLLG